MNSWAIKKMSEVTRLVTDGKHGDCEDEEDSGYFFLSSKDLRDGRLQYDDPRQITYEGFIETHRRTNLEPGDILLANCGASIGRVGIAQDDPRIYKTTFQKSVSVIKANREFVDNRFLYYFLALKSALLIRLGNGAAQPNLLIGDLKRIEVPVPPMSVQRRVTGILSAYDELIENSQRRIRLLDTMARALYREWFVHFRFPGHEKANLVPSTVGDIPKGWEVKRVGSTFQTVLGGTPSRANPAFWEDGTIPWINSGKVNDLRITEASELITAVALEKSAAKLMPKGTTVLAITGATLGQVSYLEIETTANQSVVGIIDPNGLWSEWIYLTICERIEGIIKHASGGAQQHINKEIVNDIQVAVGPGPLAKEFKRLVAPMFRELATLLFQIQNLRRTRDLLLPRLLSGQVNLEEK